jgi:hypothetical protein
LSTAIGESLERKPMMHLLRGVRQKLAGLRPVVDEEANLRRRLDIAPPVLIYQMGKVGSSSLKKSLQPRWPGLIIHTHNMARDKESRADIKLVYDAVVRNGGPVLIITPVREPIGRFISGFFQNFESNTGVKYDDSRFCTEELIRIFLQRCRQEGSLTWFERQFTPVFNLDVYDYDFPAAGIQVIQQKNIKLLLMRCELPDPTKAAAVKSFLNLPSFSLQNRNKGSDKPYAEAYEQFKRAFVPPDWFLTEMYDSRFFKHFYASERDFWTRHWAGRAPR